MSHPTYKKAPPLKTETEGAIKEANSNCEGKGKKKKEKTLSRPAVGRHPTLTFQKDGWFTIPKEREGERVYASERALRFLSYPLHRDKKKTHPKHYVFQREEKRGRKQPASTRPEGNVTSLAKKKKGGKGNLDLDVQEKGGKREGLPIPILNREEVAP